MEPRFAGGFRVPWLKRNFQKPSGCKNATATNTTKSRGHLPRRGQVHATISVRFSARSMVRYICGERTMLVAEKTLHSSADASLTSEEEQASGIRILSSLRISRAALCETYLKLLRPRCRGDVNKYHFAPLRRNLEELSSSSRRLCSPYISISLRSRRRETYCRIFWLPKSR